MVSHLKNPSAREAQRALAHAVTTLVHGEQAAESAARISELLFGDSTLTDLESDSIAMLKKEAPGSDVKLATPIADILVSSGLASSKREAREFLANNAVTLNGETISAEAVLSEDDFKNGLALLKRGKRNVRVLSLE